LSENRLRDAIELTLIPGLGRQAQKKLWQACPEISGLFSLEEPALELLGLKPEVCHSLKSRRYKAMAEEIFDWGKREGCHSLCPGDEHYPALLREIHDPPLVLYARGNLTALDTPCLAIVGTRRPTFYGLQMARGLACDLARGGITIVSGLARGIDAAAHSGSLDASGLTIAVLGCGIDIIYPREHHRLARQISEKGLLITEFTPGTSPSPQNFPVRNRIISGLSLGTMLVEASEYSGSLITARLSMEQNREVFALPGNLTSPQSFGPNYLIKQGAKLVQSWKDIVEELPSDIRRKILAQETVNPAPTPKLALLTQDETRVLKLIETDRATHFDKIYRGGGLEISILSTVLLNLEMCGWIHQIPGNLYIKVARPHN
jgi:DNA processing protein